MRCKFIIRHVWTVLYGCRICLPKGKVTAGIFVKKCVHKEDPSLLYGGTKGYKGNLPKSFGSFIHIKEFSQELLSFLCRVVNYLPILENKFEPINDVSTSVQGFSAEDHSIYTILVRHCVDLFCWDVCNEVISLGIVPSTTAPDVAFRKVYLEVGSIGGLVVK